MENLLTPKPLPQTDAFNWFKSEFQTRVSKIYERRYSLPWAATGELIPLTADLDLAEIGINSVALHALQVDYTGDVGLDFGETTDVPTMQVSFEGRSGSAVLMRQSLVWNRLDLEKERAMRSAGLLPASQSKLDISYRGARKLAERKLHDLCLYGLPNGDTRFGSFFRATTNTLNLTVDLYDAATTPRMVYDEIKAALFYFKTTSQLPLAGAKLLVPDRFLDKLSDLIDNSVATPLSLLNETGRSVNISDVIGLPELTSTSLEAKGVQPAGTNKDWMIVYIPDADLMGRRVYPLQFLDPYQEPSGFIFSQIWFQAVSDFALYDPTAMLIIKFDAP